MTEQTPTDPLTALRTFESRLHEYRYVTDQPGLDPLLRDLRSCVAAVVRASGTTGSDHHVEPQPDDAPDHFGTWSEPWGGGPAAMRIARAQRHELEHLRAASGVTPGGTTRDQIDALLAMIEDDSEAIGAFTRNRLRDAVLTLRPVPAPDDQQGEP
jgi:hypothetical protein